MHRVCSLLVLFAAGSLVHADGPGDNIPDKVRRIPPPGIKLDPKDREELVEELKKLQYAIAVLQEKKKPDELRYLPDVQIYEKAVRYALEYDEFFNVKEIAIAKAQLRTGLERADALLRGQHPWTRQTGQVVRGYRSKIDGSVQPYGVSIPRNHDFDKPSRLDFWCHGRGETLSEVNFIQSCQGAPQFATDKAIVLSLYGRYCCANKLAGEVDCFEALQHAKQDYKIDENRLVMRGFSMGGAAAWHFAVHYPSRWCAAAPGAGFSETPDFLRVFQKEDVSSAPAWGKKLFRMYDCTDYALNLFHVPTVAYSGENDSQKQAADIMAKAMKAEGLELNHIIGPKTGHSYEKGAKAEIIRQIDAIADKGRNPLPNKIKFVTYTLRYNECFWITLHSLHRHWERAQIEAEGVDQQKLRITTKNVRRFSIRLPEGAVPAGSLKTIEIDGQQVSRATGASPRGSFDAYLERRDDGWAHGDQAAGLEKFPGLQGPIDDAFLDAFLMVRPTGKPLHDKTGAWVKAEMQHAVTHWRQQFRGDAPIKDDRDVTDDDIKNNNLILWGDPSSNALLGKIADRLPALWKSGQLVLGPTRVDASTHMPILIYPNPLNPKKYVVLNSGFTFREYDYLNNARQIPKLPDWAIVDVTTPPKGRYPGKIVAADFFDEHWRESSPRK